jgi:hypothetical protein
MENQVTAILLIFLQMYFILTVSSIIHETVHLFQVGFDYEEFCFIGNKGDSIGWVVSSKIVDSNKPSMDMQAYFLEYLLSIIFLVLLSSYIGYKVVEWKE